MRESFLLKEMDEIVKRARQEVAERRVTLQELYTAREDLEKDLTQNKLKKILEKSLRALEDEIEEEVARGVNVSWIELDWEKEQLEQSVVEVCNVVTLKERPVTLIDYPAKKCPVWCRDGTGSGEITNPRQIAIDGTTQSIFVADYAASRIQVFDGEGNHLYQIQTPQYPAGLSLTEKYIFVSTYEKLVKIKKSNNRSVKSVKTVNIVWGIDTNSKRHIYGCEFNNQSIIMFDEDLKFLKRIKLENTQINSDTKTHSIKLYEDKMYVMFGSIVSPPFHLQIFTREGKLVKCLIKERDIQLSSFFSIDQLENIIVADWLRNQIKIFSKGGRILHTITSDMLPGDQKFIYPNGVAVDKQNNIIIAQANKECNLVAF